MPLPVAPSTAREQIGQPIVVKQHGQPFEIEKHVQHVVSMPVVLRGIIDRDVSSKHDFLSTFDMNDLCCIHGCCLGRRCICSHSCTNFGPYAHFVGPAGASEWRHCAAAEQRRGPSVKQELRVGNSSNSSDNRTSSKGNKMVFHGRGKAAGKSASPGGGQRATFYHPKREGRGRGWEETPPTGHQLQVGNVVISRLDRDAIGERATASDMGWVTTISKRLSFLLRGHSETDLLSIEANGLVPIIDVLENMPGNVRVYDLGTAIRSTPKIRFGIYADTEGQPLYIRADQGHSSGIIDPEAAHGRPLLPEDILELPVISHRTFETCCASVAALGLKPGGLLGGKRRAAVHFASSKPNTRYWTNAQRGRPQCDATVYLEPSAVAQAVQDGRLVVYRTPQNVLLCYQDIPNDLISSILTDREGPNGEPFYESNTSGREGRPSSSSGGPEVLEELVQKQLMPVQTPELLHPDQALITYRGTMLSIEPWYVTRACSG